MMISISAAMRSVSMSPAGGRTTLISSRSFGGHEAVLLTVTGDVKERGRWIAGCQDVSRTSVSSSRPHPPVPPFQGRERGLSPRRDGDGLPEPALPDARGFDCRGWWNRFHRRKPWL